MAKQTTTTSGNFLLITLLTTGWLAGGRVGAAESANPSPATDAWRIPAQAAIEKGLQWLGTQQKANGAWSDEKFPALTALGLWAVAGSDVSNRAGLCEKAAAFVAGLAQEDGGIYQPATSGPGSGGLATYNTAICMTALYHFDRVRFAPIILKAREYMAGSQLQGDSAGAGGFGYERPNANPRNRPDLSNTAWSMMAMRVTQDVEDLRPARTKAVDIDWEAATKYIATLQNRDAGDSLNHGGFGYEAGGERGGTSADAGGAVTLRGYGSMTYAGLEAMIYAQVDRRDPRVLSAVEWASRHWSVEENPGMGLKGLYYYYNILAKSLHLMGDVALKDANGNEIPWRKDLINALVRSQHPDGSWANSDNTFWENNPVLVTAYAVLTLEYALKP